MSTTAIRTSAPPEVISDVPKIDVPTNNQRVQSGPSDIEPIENRPNIVLEALGIEDSIQVMPEEDKANLSIVKEYVTGILDSKSLPQTVGAFKKALNDIKGEMGLSDESEPSVVLERIAGVVKAWQKLSFVSDAAEKRKLFMGLANLKSSSEVNKKVFDYMQDYQVWN